MVQKLDGSKSLVVILKHNIYTARKGLQVKAMDKSVQNTILTLKSKYEPE